MIVFQAEHNILMHPFHMLGNLYCPIFSALYGTKKQNLNGFVFFDKRRLQTCLNGERSYESVFFLSYVNLISLFKHTSKKRKQETILDLEQTNLTSEKADETNNPVPKRMSPRQLPGVYMVLCVQNNKRYYGETNNVSNRLSQHKSLLRRNIHPVVELQRDWNLYGSECFDFVALFMFDSNSKSSRIEREALELEYMGRHFSLCYNKHVINSRKKENNPFWNHHHTEATRKQISLSSKEYNKQNPQGLPIMLYGVKYPSISQASRATKHSRHTIACMLKNPDNPHCSSIVLPQGDNPCPSSSGGGGDKTQNVQKEQKPNTGLSKAVCLDGIVYSSISQAARELKCCQANIQRRLVREPQNCFYVSGP